MQSFIYPSVYDTYKQMTKILGDSVYYETRRNNIKLFIGKRIWVITQFGMITHKHIGTTLIHQFGTTRYICKILDIKTKNFEKSKDYVLLYLLEEKPFKTFEEIEALKQENN